MLTWQLTFVGMFYFRAEAETKAKLEKVSEIKKIHAQMMAIKRWLLLEIPSVAIDAAKYFFLKC